MRSILDNDADEDAIQRAHDILSMLVGENRYKVLDNSNAVVNTDIGSHAIGFDGTYYRIDDMITKDFDEWLKQVGSL